MIETAVVILNWNGLVHLRNYIPALVDRTRDEGAFIVVADNGSTDGSVEWLRSEYPGIRIITFDTNHGFTGGYNRALRQIEADYYVLLNSDVEVSRGWLTPLVGFMEEHPQAGICQPKIKAIHDRDSFEYAGAAGGFIDRFGYPFCRGRILGHIEKDCGQYDTPMEVFWASGACLVIRSSLYHHLGGLDETFFAHMEEIDLCWRAKLLGYQVWAIPASTVWHFGGGALEQGSPRKLYLNFRNNLLMLHKNLPSSIRRRRIFTRMCMDALSAAIYLLTGKSACFKAVISAHRDFRRLRDNVEVSVFEGEACNRGLYDGSIIFRYCLSRGRIKFSDLKL